MTKPLEVRGQILETFRHDLIGPSPHAADADLAGETLRDPPSRWYLAGFLAPIEDEAEAANADGDPAAQDDAELALEAPDETKADASASDDDEPEAPSAKRRWLPSSVGLTVLLDPDVSEIEAEITWGDYRTEPPLSDKVLIGKEDGEAGDETTGKSRRGRVDWVRTPKARAVRIAVEDGRKGPIPVPESAAEQAASGGLVLETHARLFDYPTPDGLSEKVRVLTVFLVNRRARPGRAFADLSFAFQARLRLSCAKGFRARRDISTYGSEEWDQRLADLHYRDLREWAVGRNAAAAWAPGEDAAGKVTAVWTDHLPTAEVERIAPNEDQALTSAVTFGLEDLAERAKDGALALTAALERLPDLYGAWIAEQSRLAAALPAASRRRDTAERLVAEMATARERIGAGIGLLAGNERAREAFRFMNLAVAMAARRREAILGGGTPEAQRAPAWRPFQLAFILLNLAGLEDGAHPDREVADLLFFPTGGGKTEAYLGLAAFMISLRRLRASGLLGAGVSVIMRYTLRLLTLDQLARAAGVVCALELLREAPENRVANGQRLLGDWPIEIGLWVGSDASPNKLGGKGDTGERTAVGRVRRYKRGRGGAPAPLKTCPWCGTAFKPISFSCTPNDLAPTNLEIRCVNTDCDFGRGRALPVLTVDEPIYSRLPAFLIATVDKFASLPWEAGPGAFFGHVERFDEARGFRGPADRSGRPLDNGWSLDPPDLIIQDELHLISGPLGTVAGLYEAAIDQLASRRRGEVRIRPKIIASTATVRRASDQIEALFDRDKTAIFPPPGLERTDSFFARTIPSDQQPARLYVGIAAQGRGPKLVFLRALTTLLAAAQAAYDRDPPTRDARSPADPYMSAICYFNALRELGGARRIVEDEVQDRAGRYGRDRRRVAPHDQPFADRILGAPLELTSRESTDAVAVAKQRLEHAFGHSDDAVDVALATNMISVGLDIIRLGLMLVQGQPKTAAEYIQATSRVGRDHNRPGLILAILNVHKPRDRLHYERFGQFHRNFYRAVEATSVTPWASRALDRALPATLVAAARHGLADLTAESGAGRIGEHPGLVAKVEAAILDRAPGTAIPGGRIALAELVQQTFADWSETAQAQAASGHRLAYAKEASARRLLHMPLDPDIPNLPEPQRRFIAGRSMRDVEDVVAVKVADPWGRPIANVDDA